MFDFFPYIFLLFLNSKIDWSISILKYSKNHQSRCVLVYVIYSFLSLLSVNSFATDGRVIFLFHVWNFLIKWNFILIQMRILCVYDVTLTRSITSPSGFNLPSHAQKKRPTSHINWFNLLYQIKFHICFHAYSNQITCWFVKMDYNRWRDFFMWRNTHYSSRPCKLDKSVIYERQKKIEDFKWFLKKKINESKNMSFSLAFSCTYGRSPNLQLITLLHNKIRT